MSNNDVIFDEAAEAAALELFGTADADAIARCRGLSYNEAIAELKKARAKTQEEARSGGPISIDGRNGVLMWFINCVNDGSLTRGPTKHKSWWRRILGL